MADTQMDTIDTDAIEIGNALQVLTNHDWDIVKHSLGYGTRGQKPGWRNHFAAESGSTDYAAFEKMVGLDVAAKGRSLGYGDYFFITPVGIQAAAAHEAMQKSKRSISKSA